ncbi:uncharacterized protein C8orf74 homolog [Ciona intestinalis]
MDNLNLNEVKHIANISKARGQQLLARHLRLLDVNFNEDLRSGALVDYYYDVLQFSTNRGMPWNEVCQSLKFAEGFFQVFTNASLVKSIATLHSMSLDYATSGYMGLENVKLLIQYLTNTVLANFNLYKFVFGQYRDEDRKKVHLKVEVPGPCMELREAQTLEVWRYEHRLNDIKIEEEQKFAILQMEEDLMMKRACDKEAGIDEKLSEQEKLSDVDVKIAEALISSLTANHVEIAAEDIGIEMKKMKTTAEIAASIQAIPLPPSIEKPPQKVPKPKSPGASRKSSGKSTSSKKKRK